MDDLLRLLLAAADDVGRSFDHAATAMWPPGAREAFHRLGVLRRSTGGLYVPCPNCSNGHVEPVAILRRPDGTQQFYISCPESLRVEVSPEMCECWEIDPGGLAAAVADLVGLKGRPQAVVPDRFWRLGRTPWPPGAKTTRQVVLARRMADDDASCAAAHVGPSGRAIVLVPHHVPDERVWQGTVPAVIALTEVMSWGDEQPVLDVMVCILVWRVGIPARGMVLGTRPGIKGRRTPQPVWPGCLGRRVGWSHQLLLLSANLPRSTFWKRLSSPFVLISRRMAA